MKKDRNGNYIGDGGHHVYFRVEEFENKEIKHSISKSETTESVYVTYYYNERSIVCRFSNHECNAVKFGDQLDGYIASTVEILYHLGLKTRIFVPNTYLSICKIQVKKVDIPSYFESDLTIKEMYNLGAGADISEHKGKLAKGSNWLILDEKVHSCVETVKNCFGNFVNSGQYIY